MRSAAHFRGHPIHAVLVPFPLAFLIGAFVFDVGGVLLNQPGLWRTGSHLAAAGIVTALFAAIPGFIDYVRAVPPQSSGRERATRHMLLNLTTVAVFAVAVALRGFTAREPGLLPLVLEGLGALMLSFSGWMGGTLVVRNQIGVDHRYADAGRWKDQSVETGRGKPVVVAGVEELKVNHEAPSGERQTHRPRSHGGGLQGLLRWMHSQGWLAGGWRDDLWNGAVPVAWLAVRCGNRRRQSRAGEAGDRRVHGARAGRASLVGRVILMVTA
jgi:uncharacterized membrane protein